MNSTEFFISGIDTDCGKTYITGLLAYHLRKRNYQFITTKLVQTGCQGIADDLLEHRRIMESDLLPEDHTGLTCTQVYSYPASPHLAAEIDKQPLQLSAIRTATNQLKAQYPLVLTEGAGGLMVPLQRGYLATDFILEHRLPLVLVTSSKLGSINHTLLSLAYCKQQQIDLRLVIFNEFPDADTTIAKDSFQVIGEYIKTHFPSVVFIHSKELNKEKNAVVLDAVFR